MVKEICKSAHSEHIIPDEEPWLCPGSRLEPQKIDSKLDS